ncbi:hypothetical protein BG61_22550 [Caballeronia glathei]|uniref:Uncharacterized protein n=1 Tax=Caballeronia glathei TaxID=60547 RepID=A0A069PJE1_9BURK|nr:hypothetical protein BG61_22550 [Caballeronia glathei]
MGFEEWFRNTFASQIPVELAEYVVEHPSGMENGYGPKLWKADWIQGDRGQGASREGRLHDRRMRLK